MVDQPITDHISGPSFDFTFRFGPELDNILVVTQYIHPDYITEGLAPVLSLTQEILTDGTLRTDFLGRPECRTFVLDTGEEEARDVNLFGSANIESWLHLQLCNKVSSAIIKHQDCYQTVF